MVLLLCFLSSVSTVITQDDAGILNFIMIASDSPTSIFSYTLTLSLNISSLYIVATPQTTTEVREIKRPTTIVIEYAGEPTLIICEVTCGAEICDPILRLDIPGSNRHGVCRNGVITYLPAYKKFITSGLYSYNASRRSSSNNVTVAEFIIILKSFRFHEAFATCVSSLDDITAQIDFVLVFNPIPPAICAPSSECCPGEDVLANAKQRAIPGTPLIPLVLILIKVLIHTLIIIKFVVRHRYRKKITDIEEQTLLMRQEHVTELKEEVKQKETPLDQDVGHIDNNSRTLAKLNDKLPDTIKSRSE